jgi:hypothetical protein
MYASLWTPSKAVRATRKVVNTATGVQLPQFAPGGSQNSLHLSKKLRIIISMETNEFILEAWEQEKVADC